MRKHTENGGRSPKKTLSLSGKSRQKSTHQIPDKLKREDLLVDASVHISKPTLKDFQYQNETSATFLHHKIAVNPKKVARNSFEYSLITKYLKIKYQGPDSRSPGICVDYSGNLDDVFSDAENQYFESLRRELELILPFLGDIQVKYFGHICNVYLTLIKKLEESPDDLIQLFEDSARKIGDFREGIKILKFLEIAFKTEFWAESNIDIAPYDLQFFCFKQEIIDFYQSKYNGILRFFIPENAVTHPNDLDRLIRELLKILKYQFRSLIFLSPESIEAGVVAPFNIDEHFAAVNTKIKEKEKLVRDEENKIFIDKALLFAELSNNEHLQECIEQGYSCRELYYSARFDFIREHIKTKIWKPLAEEFSNRYRIRLEFNGPEYSINAHGPIADNARIPSLVALKLRKAILNLLEDDELTKKLHLDNLEAIQKMYEARNSDFSGYGKIESTTNEFIELGHEKSEYLEFHSIFKEPIVPQSHVLYITVNEITELMDSDVEGENE